MRRFIPFCLVLSLVACSDKKSAGPTPPAGATLLSDYLKQRVVGLFPALNGVDAVLPLIGNPGAPGGEAIQFTPDTTPGAPPYSYTFQLPLDWDLDGAADGQLTGHCRLSGDPANAAVGFGGTVELNAGLAGALGTIAADVEFLITEQGTRLIGTSTFAEMVSGHTIDMTTSSESPLYLKAASGQAGGAGNACSYSLSGPLTVDARSGETSLSARWNFSFGSRDVSITQATYSDGMRPETPVADSSFRIPCGTATLAQWVGVYEQQWTCVPAENGSARLTLSVANATTLHIVDEDPPGSGQKAEYDAAIVSGNAGVVHGFFIGGDAGGTYREDFTWTLAPDHQGFTQIALYRPQGGAGTGGICAARAVRSSQQASATAPPRFAPARWARHRPARP